MKRSIVGKIDAHIRIDNHMNVIKHIVLSLLRVTGLIKLFFYFHHSEIVILMVHGIVDENTLTARWRPSWCRHDTVQFDRVLNTLERYCRFISIDDAVEMLNGVKPMISNGIVITFDDGYRNNQKYAYPILKKYGVPACYFLTTRFIDGDQPYWIDRLDYALQQLDADYIDAKLSKFKKRIYLKDRVEFERSYREFRLAVKKIYRDDWEMLSDLNRFAIEVEAKSGRNLAEFFSEDDWSAILTSRELMDLPDDVTIGSHTVDHVRAGRVSEEDFEDQLRESKIIVDDHHDRNATHFCFPDGACTPEAMLSVQTCGYASAVTTISGVNEVGDNVYSLRRISFPRGESKEEILLHVMRNMLS